MTNEWSDMQMSGGFLGWIHRIVMFITWPLRHFKKLLIILCALILVMIIIPMCYGVKFGEIFNWYKTQLSAPFVVKMQNTVTDTITEAKNKAEQQVSEKIENIKEKVQQISPQIADAQEAKEKGEPIRFTTWNITKFNKAKYIATPEKSEKIKLKAPTFAVLKRETKEAQLNREQQQKENYSDADSDIKFYDGNIADLYVVRPDLELTYLPKAERVHGKADVLSANSLYISGTYIYLYGIWTNPNVYNEEAAIEYLENLVEGKTVHCDIVAYTTQSQAATGLCFVDNIYINRDMIAKNLAKNVALREDRD